MKNPAQNQYEIHDLLKERWSPRAFSSQPVAPESLLSLFEAARWSPSGGNGQPWSFIVVTNENPELHRKLVEATFGNNQIWTKAVPTLVLAVAKINPEKPAYDKFAYYDVGQAVAHLSVQAGALGLHVHQMAGFNAQAVRELFEIPEGYDLLTLFAIGYAGDLEQLSGELREREVAPRTRKPISEFVFTEHWNQPLALPALDESAAD